MTVKTPQKKTPVRAGFKEHAASFYLGVKQGLIAGGGFAVGRALDSPAIGLAGGTGAAAIFGKVAKSGMKKKNLTPRPPALWAGRLMPLIVGAGLMFAFSRFAGPQQAPAYRPPGAALKALPAATAP